MKRMIPETSKLGKWEKTILETLAAAPEGKMKWEDLTRNHPGHAPQLRSAANTLYHKRGFIGTTFKPNTNTIDTIRLSGPGREKCRQLGYLTN